MRPRSPRSSWLPPRRAGWTCCGRSASSPPRSIPPTPTRRRPRASRRAPMRCAWRGQARRRGAAPSRRRRAGRRQRGRARPAHPAQGRDRGRGARLPRLAVGPAPQGAGRRRGRLGGQGAHAAGRDRGALQAPRAGGGRRLYPKRRMAGQGRRLCHPGPRRRASSPSSPAPTAMWSGCRCSRRWRCCGRRRREPRRPPDLSTCCRRPS